MLVPDRGCSVRHDSIGGLCGHGTSNLPQQWFTEKHLSLPNKLGRFD
jgi:hypothetical protein